jgi:hypothetical protein
LRALALFESAPDSLASSLCGCAGCGSGTAAGRRACTHAARAGFGAAGAEGVNGSRGSALRTGQERRSDPGVCGNLSPSIPTWRRAIITLGMRWIASRVCRGDTAASEVAAFQMSPRRAFRAARKFAAGEISRGAGDPD